MNVEQKSTDQDSKKIFTMLILVVTLVICTTSATYAYFALSATNNVATGTAATVSLTLNVTQATLKTSNTAVMVPQKEVALASAMNSTNQCVDANGNIICKVYTVTVTNTSSAAVKVNGTIQFELTGTNVAMANLKWKRATSATILGTTTGGSYDGVEVGTLDTLTSTSAISTTSAIFDIVAGTTCTVSSGIGCTDIPLAKTNGSVTYYLVVWIDETDAVQTDGGTWRATIKFEGENGTGVTSTITA